MDLLEPLTREAARELGGTLGLSRRELEHIEASLGRPPTRTELSVFAGMWSEHCSYKSTLPWLKTLPKDGPHVLAGPGSHAGVVAVDDTWAVAFKIESHNHPSAVEPYQGAATGVGGILRDVIAQGARPCAVMDALCFGEPGAPRQGHLIEGVVAGIAGYGNAFGVPNVGGTTAFDRRYAGNILVNALAAGLLPREHLRSAEGARPGDLVLYAGATTGRDGILGAAFASEELGDDTVESRPHVQVGDPFTGKKLMEACVSFTPQMGNRAGQDMGASGITCAAFEVAAQSGVGVEIDLETIPLREPDMSPHEIMLSESQERFLYIVAPEHGQEACQHFIRHGLHAVICGRVVEGDRTTVKYKGRTVVDLPAALVAGGCPLSDWPLAPGLPAPEGAKDVAPPAHLGEALLGLLHDPNLASKAWLTSRYDQTVGNRTVRGPHSASAAVLKLPSSEGAPPRGFALAIASRGELCGIDPFAGAQATVAEVMRKLAGVGAEMVAVTDGLNVASPRDPVENRKLERVIAGLGEALRTLGVPVTGGNCSLYNESSLGPIPPTPIVGGVGLVPDVRRVPPARRLQPGWDVVLLGTLLPTPHASRYGVHASDARGGEPFVAPVTVDLPAEKALAVYLVPEVRAGHVQLARPIGQGGIATALAKIMLHAPGDPGSAAPEATGVDVCLEGTLPSASPAPPRVDWVLFGEPPATMVLVTRPEDTDGVLARARDRNVPAVRIGSIAADATLRIACGEHRLALSRTELEKAYGETAP